ncbi:hypothetical protein HJG54_06570 [Leptolyngbya sp. NK1-12]|uniref:Uncharacterized protein n=1 Tax=Leptolyngbya sp. NK1-12 TaxID=2547451 RepID=A0AA96WCR5_9CYAN|nr:hypothetical protein [Leptolyngbya sp. NK1-12]MBF2047940.1 hypothetical protein [Elainella sp. C42_A2020_010]WNZ22555.1 hypothetical protein HJG54_06570 [Leptolyngbya sp. NK1-12]
MGQIVFYEGNGGSQNIVHTIDDSPGQDFHLRQNDEARSVKLLNVRQGCFIEVFDHPEGQRSDDFCVIEVRRSSSEYTVNTFERSYDDEYVIVSYANNNGLDGKVSRVRVN